MFTILFFLPGMHFPHTISDTLNQNLWRKGLRICIFISYPRLFFLINHIFKCFPTLYYGATGKCFFFVKYEARVIYYLISDPYCEILSTGPPLMCFSPVPGKYIPPVNNQFIYLYTISHQLQLTQKLSLTWT